MKPSPSSDWQDGGMFALTQQVGYFRRFLYPLKQVTGILYHDFGPVLKKRWVKYFFKNNRKATDAQSSSTHHVLVPTESAFIAHTSIRGNPLRWITGVLLLRQSPHLVLSIFSSGLLVIYFSIILFWEKQYKTFFYFTAILFLQKEFKPILLSLYEMFITQVRFRTANNCLQSLQLSLQWKKCFQDCKWVMSVKMQTRSVL